MSRTASARSLRACIRLAVTASLAVPGAVASAQVRPSAVSPAALADSLKLLDSLGTVVRAEPGNAEAWLRRGEVAIRLVQLARQGALPAGFDEPRAFRAAHESFNRALALDRENSRVFVGLAHLKNVAGGVQGPSAIDLQYEAFRYARSRQDSAYFTALALGMGRVAWNEYETFAERAVAAFAEESLDVELGMDLRGQRGQTPPDYSRGAAGPIRPGQIAVARAFPRTAEPGSVLDAAGIHRVAPLPVLLYEARDTVLRTMSPMSFEGAGEGHYLIADLWVERALRASPDDQRAYLEYARVLVARNRWSELHGIATARIQRLASDPWGWMALGLAQQRLRLTREARVAFDSALARFDDGERTRLDRLDRVLRNGEAVQFRRSDTAARVRTANASWLLADPLWSNDEEDPRTEFLARVAFSELRWTYGIARGADSPRGDIYVRYGPPDAIIGPFWLYDSGLMFALSKSVAARNLDPGLAAQIREWQPSRWDNIAATRIDSMPIQVARFRGPADSVDVLIAVTSPLDSMRARAGVGTSARADVWLYGWDTPDAKRDSVAPHTAPGLQWTYRVASGRYYYRIESTVPGAVVAGRAAATATFGADTVTGFTTRGFGVSDLLLATSAEAGANAARWTDVELTPLTGSVPRGSSLAMIWETYELERTDGEARYSVTITLTRERSGAGRIAANIASRIGTVVGIDRRDNELAVTFERTVPHASAVTDLLTIELGETPPGGYRLQLSIADRASGRTTTRETRVVVQ